MEFSNEYAPEHLILHLENAPGVVGIVQNAGMCLWGLIGPRGAFRFCPTSHTYPPGMLYVCSAA